MKWVKLYIVFSIFLFTNLILADDFDHLIIMYTNDIEGYLAPTEAFWINPHFPPPVGNAKCAATVIKEERKKAQELGYEFLLLDAGDFIQGSPIGDFSKGEALVEYFNTLGYDCLTLGNHDFPYGPSQIEKLAHLLNLPFLGANIIDKVTGDNPEFIKPYIILERGVKIGIFGVVTQYMPGLATPQQIEGLEFLPETETVKRCVEALRDSVDLIIGLTHIGLRHDKRIASSVPGIDIIFGAHSGTALVKPYEDSLNHTIICQAYQHLSCVGKLELLVDKDTKKIAGYTGELIDLYSEKIPADPEMETIVEKWRKRTERGFDEIIGEAASDLSRAGMEECSMGNLITDAMRQRFKTDIAFQNSGGIRASFSRGSITYRDCYKVDAFANLAVIMTFTGRQVWEALEVSVNRHHAIFQVSGLTMKYDVTRPIGNRVLEITVDGEPIDTNRKYRIVTNNFLAAGGGEYGIFKEGEEIVETDVYIRDVIVDYVRENSPVDAKVEGRIVEIK